MGCSASKKIYITDEKDIDKKSSSFARSVSIVTTTSSSIASPRGVPIESSLSKAVNNFYASSSSSKSGESNEQGGSFSVDNAITNPDAEKNNAKMFWTAKHKVRSDQLGSFSLQIGLIGDALSGRERIVNSRRKEKKRRCSV